MGVTVWQSLSTRTEEMALGAFRGVETLEDWRRVRPARRREFMRGLGLEPLPGRGEPGLVEHGEFSGRGFRARRVSFEVAPGCRATAGIYYPDPAPPGRLPGVLYVCGHHRIGTWHYQSHGIMWARRGYACLVLDTIEQNDNPGEHHGAWTGRYDRWLSLGYTAAGGELWNTMRALDILAADPLVDPERLGATGVSGGGACSFFIGAADERIKAVSTLCGICSPRDAVANRHLDGHCDCFFPFNTAARDISEYGALIAPRPALFCFAEHDGLFQPEETRALVERIGRVYRLEGRPENCRLCEIPGAHGDHPEFDEATAEWFDRHLAGAARAPLPRGSQEVPESETTVFNGAGPAFNHLDRLAEMISPRDSVPLPRGPGEWPGIRERALGRLKSEVFTGPERIGQGEEILEQYGQWSNERRGYRGRVDGVDINLSVIMPFGAGTPLVMAVSTLARCGMDAVRHLLAGSRVGEFNWAVFEPRLSGRNCLAAAGRNMHELEDAGRVDIVHRRALALAGLTPATATMRDIGVAVECLFAREKMAGRKFYLYGRGESGVAALYHAIFDERVDGVIVEDVPATHLDGMPVFGILRVLDLPQALGLVLPRPVFLVGPAYARFTWPDRLAERLGLEGAFKRVPALWQALGELAEPAA